MNDFPGRSIQPQRAASLSRFREKRKERCFDKKIRYNVRKEVALRYYIVLKYKLVILNLKVKYIFFFFLLRNGLQNKIWLVLLNWEVLTVILINFIQEKEVEKYWLPVLLLYNLINFTSLKHQLKDKYCNDFGAFIKILSPFGAFCYVVFSIFFIKKTYFIMVMAMTWMCLNSTVQQVLRDVSMYK